MRYEWKLPDVGEGIHEAEIICWLVRENDLVEVDQVVAEIQTDKATVEIPSPVNGIVVKINAAEGDIVKVGTVVLEFEVETKQKEPVQQSETLQKGTRLQSAGNSITRISQFDPSQSLVMQTSIRSQPGFTKPLATPAIRRISRELGVDLREVKASGSDGRITEDDVRNFANKSVREDSQQTAQKNLAPVIATFELHDQEERIPIRGLRRAISERMVRSKFTVPHVTGMDEIDVTKLVKLRHTAAGLVADTGFKVTYLPFVIKAVVSALKAFPYFNASVDDERGEFVLKRYYNIGIAVDTPEGLVVPVIHHADQKSILELAEEISVLTEKAHNRTLELGDIHGGTFTISNIGTFGGLFATPVINHPEVAILATGRIERKPVALDDDTIVVRQMMPISVTFDHRIIDGGTSGRFIRHVMEHLQNPIKQFLEMK